MVAETPITDKDARKEAKKTLNRSNKASSSTKSWTQTQLLKNCTSTARLEICRLLDLPKAAEDPPGLALLLQKSLGTFACYCSLPPHRQEEGHGPGHLLQAIPLWLGQHCQRLVAGHTCVRHGSTLSHTAPSPGADLGSLLGYVLFGLRKMSQKPAAMRQCFARKNGK